MELRNQTVIDDLLVLASQSIGARTLFISNIESTFKILKVFNRDGCNVKEGLELPKDHSI